MIGDVTGFNFQEIQTVEFSRILWFSSVRLE